MKRQLLVAQLPVLFEQRTAQRRFGGQPAAAGPRVRAQVRGHETEQRGMCIEWVRHALELAADVVCGELFEYTDLRCAFCAYTRTPGFWALGSFGNQWFDFQ